VAKKHGRSLRERLKSYRKHKKRVMTTPPFLCPNCGNKSLSVSYVREGRAVRGTVVCLSCNVGDVVEINPAGPHVGALEVLNKWIDKYYEGGSRPFTEGSGQLKVKAVSVEEAVRGLEGPVPLHIISEATGMSTSEVFKYIKENLPEIKIIYQKGINWIVPVREEVGGEEMSTERKEGGVKTIEFDVREPLYKVKENKLYLQLKSEGYVFQRRAFRRFLKRIGLDPAVWMRKGDGELQREILSMVPKVDKRLRATIQGGEVIQIHVVKEK